MTDIHYNEQALLEQLMLCTEYVDKAERYELLGPLYRLVIPIYERRKDYQALLTCYQHLTKAYAKVIEVTNSGKRLLGRFYRVAFFGKAHFGEDEEGIEFIYKEPKLTSLSEISEKLHNFYEQKFGSGCVKMIMDSAPASICLNLITLKRNWLMILDLYLLLPCYLFFVLRQHYAKQ